MEVTFVLHGERYIYVSLYADDDRVYKTIGATATPEEWASGKLQKITQNRINRVRVVVNDYVNKTRLANERVLRVNVEELILSTTGRGKAPKSDKVGEAMELFVKQTRSGELLNKGKKWGDSSVMLFKCALSVIKAAGLEGVRLNEFNLKHFEQFKKTALTKKRTLKTGEVKTGLSQNTLSLYVTHLRTFFSRTRKLGWHKNVTLEDKGLHVPQEEIDTKVYVSSKELAELYNLEINNKHFRATMDAFVFGCHIGQRLSDALQIKPVCRVGNKLDLSTIKKGWRVVIPMNPTAIEIWDKYNGEIPFSPNFTVRVQELFKHLNYDKPTLYSYTVGGVKDTRYWPKWELMSSHTMRRSFATNAYLAKIPIPSIMKISGHRDIKSFLKYLCIDVEENADILLGHEFFK